MNCKLTLITGFLYAGAILLAAEAKFNAEKNMIDFGDKKLNVANNGTFTVINKGRLILNCSFCTGTPYSPYAVGNGSSKGPKKYDGGAFCVTEFKADPETRSFITKGMVPYHKKGEKVNAKEWTQVIKLLPDGKVDYTVILPIPEGYNYRQGGRTVFFILPTADGYSYGAGLKNMFNREAKASDPGKLIRSISRDPSDEFTIKILSKNLFVYHIGTSKQIRIGLHPSISFMNLHFVFDFNPETK